MTTIEWTRGDDGTDGKVWNPVVGCSRVSAGCQHCYAERVAHRGMQDAHKGLTVLGAKGPRWTGEVRTLPARLGEPLRWRKPRRVFVNSMSDLFHESVPFEFIAAVFGVMALTPQHTYQVLTKRPKRMLEFFEWVARQTYGDLPYNRDPQEYASPQSAMMGALVCHPGPLPGWDADDGEELGRALGAVQWPLPNVWLGVSVEDQATADARIPLLLECPAAVRWVSYEPALGAIDFTHIGGGDELGLTYDALRGRYEGNDTTGGSHLDWIVVGGESGPGARPYDVAWARNVITQGRETGVPVFHKQLGSRPQDSVIRWVDSEGLALGTIHDRKGGDMSEWPEDLRVREWPEVSR